MPTSTALKKLVFAVVASLYFLAAIWFLLLEWTSFHYGFHLQYDETTGSANIRSLDSGYPAAEAGLRVGDIVFSVDGNRPSSQFSCEQCLIDSARAREVELEVARDGKAETIRLRGVQRGIATDRLLFVLTGLVYFLMGVLTFFARPQYRAANSWGYFSILLGVLLLSGGSLRVLFTDIYSLSISIFLVSSFVFSAPAALDFALVFPRPRGLALRRWTLRVVHGVPIFLFVILFAFLLLYFFGERTPFIETVIEAFNGVYLTYWAIYLALAVVTMLATYLRTGEIEERQRIRWISIGTAVPLGFILLFVVLHGLFNTQMPFPYWMLIVALAVIPIAYFYAIVRHRAMQVEVIVRRGLIYSIVTGTVILLTGVVFALVFGLLLLLQDLLPKAVGMQNAVVAFFLDPTVQKIAIALWAVLVGVMITRLKRRAQDFVDRRFYRQKYNYRQALRQLTSVLDQAGDIDRMFDIVIENAEQLVHPSSVAIALIDDDGSANVERSNPNAISETRLDRVAVRELLRIFEGSRKYIGVRELWEEKRVESGLARESLVRLGADICLPLQTESGAIGFFFLGPKLSELSYNLEDIELLAMLADQTARGVEHKRLSVAAVEKERIQREIEIGREIQRSLLPDKAPRIKGASIAALNLPAMEVGGDFYSFVEYDRRKLGIIVGDIVGKGVAGAINMAATISTLRLIAEESASLPETMQRLNRYLVRDSSSRSFAAIIFALMDLQKMTLRWSNAGLPEPVLLPASGSAKYLEMESYPLPPGASNRSAYLEARYDLTPGDTLLFVTDGVIETRPANGSGREIGFEGLLAFLNMNRERRPDALLASLAEKLTAHRGSEDFEDDITVVAVRIDN